MKSENKSFRLPGIISNGMIMQRDSQIRLWGYASAGNTVMVHFLEKSYQTIVSEKGEWQLSVETGPAGGPYDLKINEKETAQEITVSDILLGEVWLCSGQSNMEMKMLFLREAFPEEVSDVENSRIRQFLIPVQYNYEGPQNDTGDGSWKAVNPKTILDFSAVGYYFAKYLYEKYQVPIGIINASMGGAPAQSWMSEEGLSEFPEELEKACLFRNKAYEEQVLKKNQSDMEEWNAKVKQKDIGMTKEGLSFYDPAYNAEGWRHYHIPSFWEEEGLGYFNGAVWFRREIDIPSGLLPAPAKILLGQIIEEDTVYINGTKIGSLPMQYIPRNYEIPDGILKSGKNTIVIRVTCNAGLGGFYKEKPYYLQIGDKRFDLNGDWLCRIGARCEPAPRPVFAAWQPTGLYNAMIAPVQRYIIKGAIWYQGETNAQIPDNYEALLRALIFDWRKKWNLGEFPFLIVQLPNFLEPPYSPAGRKWAEIREAQRRALSVPNTGLVVTIDLGEWNDVHPKNKKDLGYRLALAAQKLAYKEDTVTAFGPLLQLAEREENRVILSFRETGSGLVCTDGKRPGHFSIAGKDKKFKWADTRLENNRIIVWNEEIAVPVYVRYAWADNPEGADLYNREGLPASPFQAEL